MFLFTLIIEQNAPESQLSIPYYSVDTTSSSQLMSLANSKTRPNLSDIHEHEFDSEGSSNKVEAEKNGECASDVHKVWRFDDPLKFEPPRPEGDPWDILLDPLMKKDKMRCDAWRDEVQNLLIFAGLFSAVVTAFIVESYKSLQPDPNDSIINLLSHIATRLDRPLDANSTFSPAVVQSFSPSTSSVRVNSFWFISLVLSLTTVLVGIIALQWLREHQSYSTELTSREKYGLYVMRANGLKTWQVDKIFNSLPLLLQSALILFVGGVIDFLQAIGNLAVLIPVAAVVGLTLMFLVMTTLLPCFQVLLLYSDLFLNQNSSRDSSQKMPPSQCPYKSPQSHAVRNLWLSILRLYSSMRYKMRFQYRIWRFFPHFQTTRATNENDDTKSHFTRYLYAASSESNWTHFDLAWLAIRDGYMRLFFERSSSTEYIARTDVVPIFDIVLGLLDQRYYTSLFPSTYHCLTEIFDLTMQPAHTSGFPSIEDFFRQSSYLYDLVASKNDLPLPKCFISSSHSLNRLHGPDVSSTIALNLSLLLHQQITESFIPYHFSRTIFPLASIHRMELRLRLLRSFFSAKEFTLRLNLRDKIPDCLGLHHYHAQAIVDHEGGAEVFAAFAWQFAHLTRVILEQTNLHPESAAHHPSIQRVIVPFMETSGYYAERLLNLESASSGADKLEYYSVFNFIEEILQKEMATWTDTDPHPSLFFYTSSLFAYYSCFDWSTRTIDQIRSNVPFRSMCTTVCVYRERTIDTGICDSDIEKQLTREVDSYAGRLYDADSPRTFSSQWWIRLAVYSSDSISIHSPHTSSVDSK